MAMFAPIPLPGNNNVFKDVMDYLQQVRNRKAQQEQFAQQLEERKSEFSKNLALRQQAESRAQSLMPYMIQQYKDQHGKEMADTEAKNLYRNLIKEALAGGSTDSSTASPTDLPKSDDQSSLTAYPGTSDNPLLPDQNRQHLQQFLSQNPNLPDEQKEQISNFLQIPQSPMTANGMPLSQGGMPGAPSPALPGQMPGQIPGQIPVQPGVQLPGQSLPQTMPSGAQGGIAPNQEVTLKPGNPRLDKLDKVAGLVPGIPKPETHFTPNGMMITRYPSGRVTMQNTGVPGMKTVNQETPEERQTREVSTAISKEQGIGNAKKTQDYLTAGDTINEYSGNLETIYKLLNKNRNLTGNVAGLKNMAHLSNEDQGKFNAATVPLIGKLAKDISTRGGAVVAGMATAGKPGIWKSHQENMGLTKHLIEEAIRSYNNAKKGYEKITGKSYPKEMPAFLKQYQASQGVKVTSPNGKIIRFPEDKVDEFLKDHPDHKRVE